MWTIENVEVSIEESVGHVQNVSSMDNKDVKHKSRMWNKRKQANRKQAESGAETRSHCAKNGTGKVAGHHPGEPKDEQHSQPQLSIVGLSSYPLNLLLANSL